MIPPQVYREMGLNDDEYLKVEAILGREPTETELGMFAVMWSEHSGYGHSRPGYPPGLGVSDNRPPWHAAA